MKKDNTKVKLWVQLHKESRFRPKYPSEVIVQFLFRNFKDRKNSKILDLGCGAGRHLIFLAKEGVETYGIDYSQEGVNHAIKEIKEIKLKANICVGDIQKLPYEDMFFDGVISYGVLYYLKYESIKKAIDEVFRILKKGGKAIFVVRNINDFRCGNGDEIEKNTFILKTMDRESPSFNENGMVMHFFDKSEITELFSRFEEVEINEITETHNEMKEKDSNYIITVRK